MLLCAGALTLTLVVVLMDWTAFGLVLWLTNQPSTLAVSLGSITALALLFANVWFFWLLGKAINGRLRKGRTV